MNVIPFDLGGGVTGRIEVRDDSNTAFGDISIFFDGHGVCNTDPGKGAVIYIEKKDGLPAIYVWSDIQEEEPMIKGRLEYSQEKYRAEWDTE